MKNEMQALLYPEYGKLTIAAQPVPSIAPDEVLLKVGACGICGSELESFISRSERRKPPLIMGHEFSGTVAEVGQEVKDFREGMRVVSNSLVSCGVCSSCRRGETNLCVRRQIFGMQRGGAFAEYVNVPARCLIPMSDHVSFEAACLSEPLANGVHMVGLTNHLQLNQVLVFGAGPIGLMAQLAFQALRNVPVIVSDIKDERLAVAKKLGAVHTINSAKENIEESIAAITAGDGLDLVVDAVGMELTNSMGLKLLRPGGTMVMIGLHQNSQPYHSYDIILPEKKIIGSYACKDDEMKTALDLITDGRVDVTSWIDYFPLSEGATVFAGLVSKEKDWIKTVLTM